MSDPSSFITVCKMSPVDLWHQRLEHLYNSHFKKVLIKVLVNGVGMKPVDEICFCEGSVMGKMHKNHVITSAGKIRSKRRCRVDSVYCL